MNEGQELAEALVRHMLEVEQVGGMSIRVPIIGGQYDGMFFKVDISGPHEEAQPPY